MSPELYWKKDMQRRLRSVEKALVRVERLIQVVETRELVHAKQQLALIAGIDEDLDSLFFGLPLTERRVLRRTSPGDATEQ